MNTADAFIVFLRYNGYKLSDESPFCQFFQLIFKKNQKNLKQLSLTSNSNSNHKSKN